MGILEICYLHLCSYIFIVAKDGKLGIRVPQHETEKIRSWNQTKNLSPSQQDSIAMFNAEFETQLREAMHALIESAFMKEQFETENVTLQVREGDNVAELQVPLFVKSKRLKCIDPERVINTIWSGLRGTKMSHQIYIHLIFKLNVMSEIRGRS